MQQKQSSVPSHGFLKILHLILAPGRRLLAIERWKYQVILGLGLSMTLVAGTVLGSYLSQRAQYYRSRAISHCAICSPLGACENGNECQAVALDDDTWKWCWQYTGCGSGGQEQPSQETSTTPPLSTKANCGSVRHGEVDDGSCRCTSDGKYLGCNVCNDGHWEYSAQAKTCGDAGCTPGEQSCHSLGGGVSQVDCTDDVCTSYEVSHNLCNCGESVPGAPQPSPSPTPGATEEEEAGARGGIVMETGGEGARCDSGSSCSVGSCICLCDDNHWYCGGKNYTCSQVCVDLLGIGISGWCGDGACEANRGETEESCPDDCQPEIETPVGGVGEGEGQEKEEAEAVSEQQSQQTPMPFPRGHQPVINAPLTAMCGNGDCEIGEIFSCPKDCLEVQEQLDKEQPPYTGPAGTPYTGPAGTPYPGPSLEQPSDFFSLVGQRLSEVGSKVGDFFSFVKEALQIGSTGTMFERRQRQQRLYEEELRQALEDMRQREELLKQEQREAAMEGVADREAALRQLELEETERNIAALEEAQRREQVQEQATTVFGVLRQEVSQVGTRINDFFSGLMGIPGYCGDGKCEADLGETYISCSDDCPYPGPSRTPYPRTGPAGTPDYCGDGKCTGEENFTSCLQDCAVRQTRPIVPSDNLQCEGGYCSVSGLCELAYYSMRDENCLESEIRCCYRTQLSEEKLEEIATPIEVQRREQAKEQPLYTGPAGTPYPGPSLEQPSDFFSLVGQRLSEVGSKVGDFFSFVKEALQIGSTGTMFERRQRQQRLYEEELRQALEDMRQREELLKQEQREAAMEGVADREAALRQLELEEIEERRTALEEEAQRREQAQEQATSFFKALSAGVTQVGETVNSFFEKARILEREEGQERQSGYGIPSAVAWGDMYRRVAYCDYGTETGGCRDRGGRIDDGVCYELCEGTGEWSPRVCASAFLQHNLIPPQCPEDFASQAFWRNIDLQRSLEGEVEYGQFFLQTSPEIRDRSVIGGSFVQAGCGPSAVCNSLIALGLETDCSEIIGAYKETLSTWGTATTQNMLILNSVNGVRSEAVFSNSRGVFLDDSASEPVVEEMKRYLDEGNVLFVLIYLWRPDGSRHGHYVMIDDYNEETGDLLGIDSFYTQERRENSGSAYPINYSAMDGNVAIRDVVVVSLRENGLE